jgi:glycosyltransferase involved in cell wall biosynthesis
MIDLSISVITTVRNGGRFIVETLESVKNQTFNNFEHIVVDDGSDDDTIVIIENFQKQYPDYNLILLQPNLQDRGKALNYAVSKARTEWIAIIDADDLWHPEKLEIQYEIAKQKDYDVIATSGKTFKTISEITYESIINGQCSIISMQELLTTNKLPHSSILIKKNLCVYDINRKSQYDIELWLRLLSKSCIIAKINRNLNFKRLHEWQSFEALMGKQYIWAAFVLKTHYTFKHIKYLRLYPYIFCKLIFDIFMPRSIRLFIRKFIKQKE